MARKYKIYIEEVEEIEETTFKWRQILESDAFIELQNNYNRLNEAEKKNVEAPKQYDDISTTEKKSKTTEIYSQILETDKLDLGKIIKAINDVE